MDGAWPIHGLWSMLIGAMQTRRTTPVSWQDWRGHPTLQGQDARRLRCCGQAWQQDTEVL